MPRFLIVILLLGFFVVLSHGKGDQKRIYHLLSEFTRRLKKEFRAKQNHPMDPDSLSILEVTRGLNDRHINITCQSNNTIIGEKAMNLQLEIQKDGKPAALVQRCWQSVFVAQSRMQANGHIDGDDDADNHSYLTLTIDNPTSEDAGEYQCIVHYRDDWKFLKMSSASKHISFATDGQRELASLENEMADSKRELENIKESKGLTTQSGDSLSILEVTRGLNDLHINITCQSNNTIIGEKAMNLQLEIQKDGKPAALVQRCRQSVFVAQSRMQANGHIDGDDDADNHSYLTLTIDNPTSEDAGEYQCIVHYRDDWKFLKMSSASKHISFATDGQRELASLANETVDVKRELVNIKESKGLTTESGDSLSILEVTRGLNDRHINITCQSNNTIIGEKAMNLQLEIQKDGKPAALVQRCWQSVFVAQSRMQANGHIDGDDDADNHSYLTLTIDNPTSEDAGEYQCIVHYRDDWKFLKMSSASKHISFATDCQRELASLANEMADVKRELENIKESKGLTTQSGESSISFTVGSNPDHDQFEEGNYLVFSRVIRNEGGGYDEDTGKFTAPKDGVYLFHLIIVLTEGDPWVTMDLMVNDSIRSQLRAGFKLRHSSINPFVDLRTGDIVSVFVNRSSMGVKLYEYPRSMFSGYFLKPL